MNYCSNWCMPRKPVTFWLFSIFQFTNGSLISMDCFPHAYFSFIIYCFEQFFTRVKEIQKTGMQFMNNNVSILDRSFTADAAKSNRSFRHLVLNNDTQEEFLLKMWLLYASFIVQKCIFFHGRCICFILYKENYLTNTLYIC